MKNLSSNAHWLLRIALASVLIFHGLLKFTDLEGFARMLPISFLETFLVATAEVVGGGLVLIGGLGRDGLFDLATRIGAAINIPVIVGAIAIVHWGRWNFVPTEDFPMGGFEFQAVLLLIAMFLIITGNDNSAPSQTVAAANGDLQ